MKYTIQITNIDNLEMNLVVAALNKIEFDMKDFTNLRGKLEERQKKKLEVTEEKRVCLNCLEDKSLTDFYKHKTTGNYFRNCKACHIEYSKTQLEKKKKESLKQKKSSVKAKWKWSRRAKNLARKKTEEAPYGYKLDGTPRKPPGRQQTIKETV